MLRPWKTILPVDLHHQVAVYQQIADGIIAEIKKGRLQPGAALPGSRILAADLGVNRKTVVLAYEGLIAAGWLEAADKKGTFVAAELPSLKKQPAKTRSSFEFNETAVSTLHPSNTGGLIVFNDGLPDVRLAPLDELAKAYKRIFQQKARWRMLGYGPAQGEERLRIAIAAMLSSKRGMNTGKDTVCITRGSQMALYLTAQTLIRPGDHVAIESPGYLPAWQTFVQAGAHMIHVPVDEKGLMVDELEHICRSRKLKAVYVTPHHQFPTAVSMKAERRLKLIELSNRYGFAIIEDDYDHEFHFDAKSLLPLASHEHAANVIYISSLSKLVAPAVRIGYVTGPAAFISSLAQLRGLVDRQGDPIMEQAIAELMENGAISRHAKRAFQVYKERREAMNDYLLLHLGKQVTFSKPEGGLAYWVKMNRPVNTAELAARLAKKGVSVMPTERFSFTGEPLNALRLGYASLNLQELEEGIRILSAEMAISRSKK
ncbi:GntR family transcriptional regulator / MocR family aminotransferase [Chitinophaga arvensicola]|uniref:GntR family transcriptional regulator / MocR family aminotransferase n=2 Tax=Chitinophaga arvensicola TaxID=29529 RepID=A0A1I0S962_9BACT|nr:GntR family transcriptional regulator / MocR family aminotransferase [Chitinophaga arvensicola]